MRPREYVGVAEDDARSRGHGRSGLHLFIVESRRGGGCQVLSVSGRPRRSPPARRTPAAPSPRTAARPAPAPPTPRCPVPRAAGPGGRSDERRVGTRWVSTLRSRWSPDQLKKNNMNKNFE